MPPARAAPWITRAIRPPAGSAPRVTSGLLLWPVTDSSGKTTRSHPASAVSAISRTCASRLCSTSPCRTSTCVAATRQRLTSVELRAVCLARHDDDIVALLRRGNRAHDAHDPVGLAEDRLRLPVRALQEVNPADRLVDRHALAQVDERLEEARLGREQVVVDVGRHQ